MSPRDIRLSSSDAQAEYEALMKKAWPINAAAHDTCACANTMWAALLKAEQEDRAWARTVLSRATVMGCESIGKRWTKKHNRFLIPNDDGDGSISVAGRVGARRRSTDDGAGVWQQVLIVNMTWAEVEQKIEALQRQVSTLEVNRDAMDRLVELHRLYPDTVGPAAAAKLAGTTVEAVMAGGWAAAS